MGGAAKITLTFPGLPTSANAIWRSGVAARGRRPFSYRSEAYRAWLAAVERNWPDDAPRRLPDEWPFVAVFLELSPPTRRDVDVDNRFKAFFDALTACGFWPDDSIVAEVRATLTEPVKGGRTVATFERRERKYKEIDR